MAPKEARKEAEDPKLTSAKAQAIQMMPELLKPLDLESTITLAYLTIFIMERIANQPVFKEASEEREAAAFLSKEVMRVVDQENHPLLGFSSGYAGMHLGAVFTAFVSDPELSKLKEPEIQKLVRPMVMLFREHFPIRFGPQAVMKP